MDTFSAAVMDVDSVDVGVNTSETCNDVGSYAHQMPGDAAAGTVLPKHDFQRPDGGLKGHRIPGDAAAWMVETQHAMKPPVAGINQV
jgi:hypothetical protein